MIKSAKQEDKKVMSAVKKYSPQALEGITEVNMFKDDNTVIHFNKPSGIFKVRPDSPICCKGEFRGDYGNP